MIIETLDLKFSGLNGDSNPDLYKADAVHNQLSCRTNCEKAVVCIDYKPMDVKHRCPAQRSGFEFSLRPEFSRSFSA